MILRPLVLDDTTRALGWRDMASVRTPYRLTADMQFAFYRDVVCNPASPHRYWAAADEAVRTDHVPETRAVVGLTYIEWENGRAEVSMAAPDAVFQHSIGRRGAGAEALELALREGFGALRLATVVHECYLCSPEIGFWTAQAIALSERGYEVATAHLPRRKWWEGVLWNSLYLTISLRGKS